MPRPRGDNVINENFIAESIKDEVEPDPLTFRDVYPERFRSGLDPDPMSFQSVFPERFEQLSNEEKLELLTERQKRSIGPIARVRGQSRFDPINEDEINQFLIDSISEDVEPPLTETEKRLRFVGPPVVDPLRPVPPRTPYALMSDEDAPMSRAALDTTKPDLSEFEDSAEERGSQQRRFVEDYLARSAAGRPAPSKYTPKVFGLDPEIAKERERVRGDLARKEQEIEEMKETDRLLKAREEKERSIKNLQAAEKMVNEYRPTDRGPLSTTGSKVAAAIAIALGEAARGFRGGQGRNVGMDLINQAIDREAKRQQDEYNRLKDRANFANNIYARAFKEFGSAEAAFETAKSALWNRAYQTADIQLKSLRDDAAADRFLKQALNSREIQKAKSQDAINKLRAAPGGLSDKMRMAARDAALKSKGLVSDFKSARGLLKSVKADGAMRQALSIFAAADKDGVTSQMLTAAGTKLSDDFQRLVNFYNRINAIAFGQAAEGQAASSISNKDVAIFRNLLANPAISSDEINRYLTFLQDKASANAVFNDLIVGRKDIEEAQLAADAYMVNVLGYKQRDDGSFYKGDFDYNKSSNLAESYGNLVIDERLTK
jgi:hypothetical protein